MPTNNFIPAVGSENVGIRTPFGTLVPPGARVAAYVGPQSESTDAYSASSLLVSTLNAGLARCRSGKGDIVFVLPGHAETITTANAFSNLVSGTRIIGVAPFGSGLMPTITYSNTAATMLLNVANVQITGMKFVPGVDAVVNYVNVSGAGCYLGGNLFNMGDDSALDMQTALILGTGATNCVVEANRFTNTGTGVSTAAITASGTGLDNLKLLANEFTCSCATTGVVNVTGTGINQLYKDNVCYNTTATTPLGFRFTDTALTALLVNNLFGFTTAVTVTTDAIKLVAVTTSNIRIINNYGVDANTVNGVVCGTGTAT